MDGESPERDGEEDEEEDSHEHDHDGADDCSKHNYYDQDEDKFVHSILSKFLIGTESSFLDSFYISLRLKALPNKIVDINLEDLLKFNFNIL